MKHVQASICVLIVLVMIAISVVPVAAFLYVPQASAHSDWHWVASVGVIPVDGVPISVPVYAEHRDAWTKHPNCVIDRVYLVRSKDTAQISAFRLHDRRGAGVYYNQEKKTFDSICFNVSFDLNGRLLPEYEAGFDDAMIALPAKIELEQILVRMNN